MSNTSTGVNFVLTFKRNHPQDRCSYGVAGNPGIVVCQRGLFVGTTTPTDIHDRAGMPETLTVDVELVPVKAGDKEAKATVAAQKVIEKAAKAAAKVVASQTKASEKAAKAPAALAAAQAKINAAKVV